MVKIRLSRISIKKKPEYIIIVTDSRSPRDSNFIEKIGFYKPVSGLLKINIEKVLYWIRKGANLNNSVKKLIRNYKKCIY